MRPVVRGRTRATFQDVHYTRSFQQRFLASLSEQIDRIVICSPYFGRLPAPFNDLLQFCIYQQRRNVKNIQIITRPPGSDNTALTGTMAREVARLGVEIFVRVNPYLHAKFYHFDYDSGYFRSFIGSSNFTLGGFRRNYELVAEIEGVGKKSPCHREIERAQNKGAIPYHSWIARGCPGGREEIS